MDWYNSWDNFIIKFVESGGITTSIGFVLTFWGCSIALRGLNTWRQQVIETPKIELAREIVESFYNVVDFIKWLRRNLRQDNSNNIRKHFDEMELNDVQCRFLEPLYDISQNLELLENFQKLKNKAKVNFKNNLDNCFDNVIYIINEIGQSAKDLYQYNKIDRTSEENEQDYIKECRKTLYSCGDDEINIKLQNIVNEVECNLKPFYQEKTNIFKRLILKFKPKEVENDK